MRHYLIINDNVVALPTAPKTIPESAVLVRSIKDLDPRRFPSQRLLTLLNAIPGNEPVKRFTDRSAGLHRLWDALQALPLGAPPRDSKQNRLIALMKRPAGAGIDELMKATGWQAHSVRGVISGTIRKKLGLTVAIESSGNSRVYRIAV